MSATGSPDDESTASDATEVTDISAATTINDVAAQSTSKIDLSKHGVDADPAFAQTQHAEVAGVADELRRETLERPSPTKPEPTRSEPTGVAPSGPQFAQTQVGPVTGGLSAQRYSANRYQPSGPTGPIPVVGNQPPNYGPPQYGPAQYEPAQYGPPTYGPPGPPRRRLGRFALIGAVVVCVVALVAGGLVWWKTTRGSDAAPPLAGQLTKEFPTAPSAAWTYGAGASDKFVSPDAYRNMYSVVDAIHDDQTLVTLGRQPGGGTEYRVIGIDGSGKNWTLSQTVAGCATTIINRRIACYNPSGVIIANASDGSIVRTIPTGSTSQLGFDGENIYTREVNTNGDGSGITLTKIGPTGSTIWSKSFSPREISPSSGDSAQLIVTASHVLSIQAANIVVAATDDGREIVNRSGSTSTRTLPDGSLVLTASTSSGQGPILVVRPDNSLIELTGTRAMTADVMSSSFADTVFVAGKPTVVSTRSSTWPSTPSEDPQSVPFATDYATVIAAGGKLTVVEGNSGTVRWATDAETPFNAPAAVTDGKRVIYAGTDGTMKAADLTTGAQQWAVPPTTMGVGSADSASIRFFVVGDTLITLTDTQITGFAPTGGDAAAPAAPAKPKSGGDSYVTRCGTPPTFTPEQFTTATGGLVVKLKVTATCPDGDVLSGAQTRVTLRDGSNLVASGYFDFSGTPLVLPKTGDAGASSRSVELTFPSGSFYRLPDTLNSSGGSSGSSSGGSTIVVECERGAETSTQAPQPDTSAGVAMSATGPAVPAGTDVGLSVDDALRRQANADRSFIMNNLNNRWVAQLSSKRPGLYADGKTWTNADILNEFLALRLRLRDVRLLWSNEWPVFSYQGWWVTVAAATFPGPEAANAWCPQQGFDPDHCFAKLISTTSGPENSTRYWK